MCLMRPAPLHAHCAFVAHRFILPCSSMSFASRIHPCTAYCLCQPPCCCTLAVLPDARHACHPLLLLSTTVHCCPLLLLASLLYMQEVYSRPEAAGTFDAVVTCFFIDTAHNVLEYLETIHRCVCRSCHGDSCVARREPLLRTQAAHAYKCCSARRPLPVY